MTDKSYPSPEELQSEFEKFFKDKFGGNVQVYTHTGFGPRPDMQPTPPAPKENDFEQDFQKFNLKPRQIKDYLDQFVIGQDDAKKALAIAVCDHYNHVKACLNQKNSDEPFEYSKQNVLILGPTGVGKSYLIKHIAKLIGVPFVKADATRFSETGYMGANVDDLIKDLVKQADDNIELAQFGIVYLDEADKLAAASDRIGRDVSGRGVQFGLLKIMEESEVDLLGGNDMASQMQAFMDFQKQGKVKKKIVNTRFILFIVSGAFTGLDDIIRKRVEANRIGFQRTSEDLRTKDSLLPLTTTQDLIDFGFEPEFVGRLPIRVACHELEIDDLFSILKNSKGSLIHQYEQAFRAYGIHTTFTDEALRQIAILAHKQKTGARALMTVCESILRDFKFELPSTYIREFTIDEHVVLDPKTALAECLARAPKQDLSRLDQQLHDFEESFFEQHGMRLKFANDARDYLAEKLEDQPERLVATCQELLMGFEHGLKLIEQNTGRQQFLITKETLEKPKAVLERWIKESYQTQDDL